MYWFNATAAAGGFKDGGAAWGMYNPYCNAGFHCDGGAVSNVRKQANAKSPYSQDSNSTPPKIQPNAGPTMQPNFRFGSAQEEYSGSVSNYDRAVTATLFLGSKVGLDTVLRTFITR